MSPNPTLRVEELEDRTVPTAIPTADATWLNPSAITVSFAPDQTDIAGAKSDLFAGLAADGYQSAGVWQKEILRALQTWSNAANINFGIVADGGPAFGIAGAIQGDPRFGDIRIGARPLAEGVLAQTTPFNWNGSSWSGDIILNSNAKFTTGAGTGYDLYSVILHETGHSLGFTSESDDPTSAMFGSYVKRTGLGSIDVTAIQNLYGARTEVAAANSIVKLDPLNPSFVRGEILIAGEVDSYTVTVPSSSGGSSSTTDSRSLIITLQTNGVSLFQGKITVTDSSGKVVASAAATDPLTGQVTLTIVNPAKNGTYTIKVQGAASDVFGIGDYYISAQAARVDAAVLPTAPAPAPATTVTGNSSLNSPAVLAANIAAADGRLTNYSAVSYLAASGETDYYQVTAPALPAGTTTAATMSIRVTGLDATPLAGRISVYTISGSYRIPVAYQVLVNANGLLSIQVLNAVAGTKYVVAVSAQAGSAKSTGNYRLNVDFNQPVDAGFSNFAGGTLSSTTASQSGTLALDQAGLVSFSLVAFGASTSKVTMTVRDASGVIVFTLSNTGGGVQPTGDIFLNAGSYTVAYTATDSTNKTFYATYSAFVKVFSDPVGMYPPPVDTTTTAPTTPPTTTPPTTSPPTTTAPPTTPTVAYWTTFFTPALASYPFVF